jgi:lathosterol oxidase
MESLALLATLLALSVVERTPLFRFTRSFFFRPFFATDVTYLLTGGVVLGLMLRNQAAQWVDATPGAGLEFDTIPRPLLVVIAIVFYDLGAYASHLLLHRFPMLWALHKVHHSSRALDWLATFRAHIMEHALRHLASPVLLILLGIPIEVVGIAGAVYTAWAAINHANVRVNLWFLEALFITPRLHRLHHVPDTSERNLGTIFSLWDRLRGTLLTTATARQELLGVPGEVETYPQSWLLQLVEPPRRLWRFYRQKRSLPFSINNNEALSSSGETGVR